MRVVVVKCGGAALSAGAVDLAPFLTLSDALLLVHGAGPRISAALADAGISSTFVDGRRRTPPEALPHIVRAFAEENAALCAAVGPRAVGILGHELGLRAVPVPELGCVGVPQPVAPARLRRLLERGAIPVVASLARGPLNVNADDTAAALAIGLGAARLVYVSDVPGVIVDGAVVPVLRPGDADAWHGALSGGIVPKVRAALDAARSGVEVAIGATAIVPA